MACLHKENTPPASGVTKLQALQKLQHRAARIVVKSSFGTPAMPIIRSLNWPTVDDIIRSEIATIDLLAILQKCLDRAIFLYIFIHEV